LFCFFSPDLIGHQTHAKLATVLMRKTTPLDFTLKNVTTPLALQSTRKLASRTEESLQARTTGVVPNAKWLNVTNVEEESAPV